MISFLFQLHYTGIVIFTKIERLFVGFRSCKRVFFLSDARDSAPLSDVFESLSCGREKHVPSEVKVKTERDLCETVWTKQCIYFRLKMKKMVDWVIITFLISFSFFKCENLGRSDHAKQREKGGWPNRIAVALFFKWRSTEAMNTLRVVGSCSSPGFFLTDKRNLLK